MTTGEMGKTSERRKNQSRDGNTRCTYPWGLLVSYILIIMDLESFYSRVYCLFFFNEETIKMKMKMRSLR